MKPWRNKISNGYIIVTRVSAFFEHTKLKPTRVIFFDDKRSNLESVSQAMHSLGIPFEGYEYQGGLYMPGELDKEIAQHQLHYLVDNEKIAQ